MNFTEASWLVIMFANAESPKDICSSSRVVHFYPNRDDAMDSAGKMKMKQPSNSVLVMQVMPTAFVDITVTLMPISPPATAPVQRSGRRLDFTED
jgi:hypothetical protein